MAQSRKFQILQFKSKGLTPLTYDLNANNGNYICSINPEENPKRCVSSFTCDGDFTISGIRDKQRNLDFIIGKVIATNTGLGNLEKIQIVFDGVSSQVMLTLSGGLVPYNMSSVRPHVQPKPIVEVKATIAEQHPEFYSLEQRILKDFNNQTLKFDVFKRKKTETFEEFRKLFWERNAEFKTIWSGTGYGQTTTDRRRSLGDIFMICKYYYPSISLETIIRWLYGKNTPGGQYCGAVEKKVFRGNYDGVLNHLNRVDEYGNLITFYTEKIK